MEPREQTPRGRVLALDVGARRIGIAVSDEMLVTAQGLETIERTNVREDLAQVARLAGERGVTLVLVGNPLNMNGEEGRQSVWVREFAEKLRTRCGLAVRLWDERLTTKEAEKVLRESGISRMKRGRAVDRLSAVLLLENYLESISIGGAPEELPG